MDGIINVYKEKGWTSFDVVAKLRRVTGERKIGHTGTLDPDATGVLPVCLGKATKVCELLTDKDKSYRAVMLLGIETDTQDISGQVLQEKELDEKINNKRIEEVMQSFVGEYMQIPPMYSALKVNGKKLYQLAREGKTVERKPRKVIFHEIIIEKIELPLVTFHVTCSKGTYIRTLCEDIGKRLGCGACMKELERTRSGMFSLKESKSIDQIEKIVDEGMLNNILIPIDSVFSEWMAVKTPENYDILVHNGNVISYHSIQKIKKAKEILEEEKLRIYDSRETFIGIYENDKEKQNFKPMKMFY